MTCADLALEPITPALSPSSGHNSRKTLKLRHDELFYYCAKLTSIVQSLANTRGAPIGGVVHSPLFVTGRAFGEHKMCTMIIIIIMIIIITIMIIIMIMIITTIIIMIIIMIILIIIVIMITEILLIIKLTMTVMIPTTKNKKNKNKAQ